MKIVRQFFEGFKILALFGAVALVVWSMPEHNAHSVDGVRADHAVVQR